MLFKSIATLAVAGLAAAQTANYTHGVAHVKNAAGVDAFFTFEYADSMMTVSYNATGLNNTYVNATAGVEYHIHVLPVPADGNCTLTAGHLDPFNVTATPVIPCDPKNVTTCQVGDLSGKHGNIIPTADGVIAPASYTDKTLFFDGAASDSINGRSVVIHNNGIRIACANLIVDGYTAPAANNGTNGTTTTAPSGSPTPKPSSAAAKLASSVALSGVIALMMMAL